MKRTVSSLQPFCLHVKYGLLQWHCVNIPELISTFSNNSYGGQSAILDENLTPENIIYAFPAADGYCRPWYWIFGGEYVTMG